MQKVAVVGGGFMGKTHMTAYQAIKQAELVALVDATPKVRREVKQQFKIAAHASIESVLEDPSIDIVDICLPTNLHKQYTVQALKAGKHVLCEKPMALTVRDCRAMLEAAQQSGKFLMIAQVLRFFPEYMAAKKILDSGELGKLKGMICQRRSPAPDWAWKGWLMKPEASGGAGLDLHIHDTDWVCYVLGRPQAVTSRGIKTKAGWDHIVTQYHYDKALAVAEGGWNYAPSLPFRAAFMAICEKGQIEFDTAKTPALQLYREGKEKPEKVRVRKAPAGKAAAGGNIEDLGGYYFECRYFVECCQKGQAPTIVTAKDGLQAVEVTLAEMKSAETGRTVKL